VFHPRRDVAAGNVNKGASLFVYWTYWLRVKAIVAAEREGGRGPMRTRIERSEPRPTHRRSPTATRSSSTAPA
jgi:hypothetical protein